ncbi:MAG: RNA repair transcriptional activator RtcR family protein [Lentisphaerales bacterium]|nr:RNA repair transcriptional activator RtcR family protein [Lentisphaerales bacterium]
MRILLSFVGFHDPFAKSAIDGVESPGPILTVAENMAFDKVILFSTRGSQERAEMTQDALISRLPNCDINLCPLAIGDPTNYLIIIREMREFLKSFMLEHSKDEFFISVSSGTPQIHACWLLLTSSGELPAEVLQTRAKKFVSDEAPLIKSINLRDPEFPRISPNVCKVEPADLDTPDPVEVFQRVGIVGDSVGLAKCLDQLTLYADQNFPVLIHGETGTGKELFSQALHYLSPRNQQNYVVANCAAIPGKLAESYFFGHKKGAFTGADTNQEGLLVTAHEGTLFLDELGELPLDIQAKLLRVIEDGLVTAIGSNKATKVNVRIVAATNRTSEQPDILYQ